MENAWVHKFKNWGDKEPKCWANVPLLLDYRCYVEGGEMGKNFPPQLQRFGDRHAEGGYMGKNYPPQLQRCLKKVGSLSVDDLMLEYGFPDMLGHL
ncbi:hypothetical protein FOA52_007263 [Chlamydomonas sp. UWO 241]|nr:hypothetical protein FOA52_007263 [Chlamydomonas sp. UWO 241]